MINNLGDYLKDRAKELDVGRADILVTIQQELDKRYPGKTRAIGLHQGKLRVITASASIAGDLRLRQMEFMATIKEAAPAEAAIDKLIIQIRGL